jgi:hypothetical protein
MAVSLMDLTAAPGASAASTADAVTVQEERARWWNQNLVQLANAYRQTVSTHGPVQVAARCLWQCL